MKHLWAVVIAMYSHAACAQSVMNFDTIDYSASVGTTAVVMAPKCLGPGLYLRLALPGSGTIGYTFDGSTPVIGAAGTTTLSGQGAIEEDVAGRDLVPCGPITVIASAAATAVTLKLSPKRTP